MESLRYELKKEEEELKFEKFLVFILFVSLIVIAGAQQYQLYKLRHGLIEQGEQLQVQIVSTKDELNAALDVQKEEMQTGLLNLSKELNDGLKSLRDDYQSDLNELSGFFESQQLESQKQMEGIREEVQTEIANIQVSSQDFTGIIDDALSATVSVITNTGQGSGVIVRDDGFIVTNYHVIEGVSQLRIVTYDRGVYNAQVYAVEKNWDIAILKIDAAGLDTLAFDDSDAIKVGTKVIAVGNPQGYDFSVTEGIVSAVDRVGPSGLDGYIQTDVPLNPGNSGGPLVSVRGRIIGITNWKVGGSESLGFAIPSNVVEGMVEEALTKYDGETAETG